MRKITSKGLFLTIALGLATLAQAQYKGVVVDAADNSPLPGAVVKSGSQTAMTDMDGRWTLDVPSGSTVTASFVGYVNKKVTLGDQKEVSIALKYDKAASTLDEVVVVGYGTQKKSNVTGAISSVKA